MNIDEKSARYQQKAVGLGSPDFCLGIYIGNQPDAPSVKKLHQVRYVDKDEIAEVVVHTGNHWRKVFNLCAKIGFHLWPAEHLCWQDYRDNALLQEGSEMALLFSLPTQPKECELQLVLGKGYREVCFPQQCFHEKVEGFPEHPEQRIIQTPYFDYRQLSNQRLDRLLEMIKARLALKVP